MEENKNNAVEKVENAIENKSNSQDQTVDREVQRYNDLQASIQAENQMADQRIERANQREHKKMEMQKARATRLRERRRRREERRQKREEQKNQRLTQRQEDRDNYKQKTSGNGGWLAAVITLGIATLVLASVLTFTFLMPSASDSALESGYQKSFYSTVEQVDNIDLNLSKVLATSDNGAIQKYLVDMAINAEIAENDLQQLPLHDENKYYTTKLVNQIGDYAKHLNNKLIEGQSLSANDRETLRALYNANLTLKNSLQEMRNNMGSDFSMRSILNGGNGNTVINGFNQLENLSVEYPELIYDGPFSDGQENREVKGLKGAEISEQTAVENFKQIFASYGLEKVKAVGETARGIVCYNVQAEVKGELLYAQISKQEGKLIMFAYAGSCKDINYSDDEIKKTASEFLTSLGIENMKPVWINFANNVYTVNFAGEQNGVILYGDLIKVRVCAETNMVIGIEAKSYYTNHTQREIEKPTLSLSQAQSKLLEGITVETTRLALVPIGNSTEKLCYEFSGEIEGSTYYIYIDASSGRQVEMFKVIKSTEGTLLM